MKLHLSQLSTTLTSPAQRRQNKYKQSAKERGLLSLDAIKTKLSKNEALSIDEFKFLHQDPEFKKEDLEGSQIKLAVGNVSVDNKVLMDAQDQGGGILLLANRVIYANQNFHGLNFPEKDLDYIVSRFNQDGDAVNTINANHSPFPEDTHSEFKNLKKEMRDNVWCLVADVYLNTNHPALAKQLYAVRNEGMELGFSVELDFEDYNFYFGFELINPFLDGLATTGIPSAPKTLTNLDNTTSNLPKEMSMPKTTKKLDETQTETENQNTNQEEVKTENSEQITQENQEQTTETPSEQKEQTTETEGEETSQKSEQETKPEETSQEEPKETETVKEDTSKKLAAPVTKPNTNLAAEFSAYKQATDKTIQDLSAKIEKLDQTNEFNSKVIEVLSLSVKELSAKQAQRSMLSTRSLFSA